MIKTVVKDGKADIDLLKKSGYIACHMRAEDKKEILYQNDTPDNAVLSSILYSHECFMYMEKGIPLCIYGITKTENGTCIWMLASQEMERHPKALIRIGMAYIKDKVKEGPVFNMISEDNIKALRYIRHAGAIFHTPIYIHGHKFIPFEIR